MMSQHQYYRLWPHLQRTCDDCGAALDWDDTTPYCDACYQGLCGPEEEEEEEDE